MPPLTAAAIRPLAQAAALPQPRSVEAVVEDIHVPEGLVKSMEHFVESSRRRLERERQIGKVWQNGLYFPHVDPVDGVLKSRCERYFLPLTAQECARVGGAMALVKSLPDGSSRLAGGVTAPTRSTWDGDVTSQTVPLFGGGFPGARQS